MVCQVYVAGVDLENVHLLENMPGFHMVPAVRLIKELTSASHCSDAFMCGILHVVLNASPFASTARSGPAPVPQDPPATKPASQQCVPAVAAGPVSAAGRAHSVLLRHEQGRDAAGLQLSEGESMRGTRAEPSARCSLKR